MSKKSKDELMSQIEGLSIDDDSKIALMEDVSDSIAEQDTSKIDSLEKENESLKKDVESWKEKYKDRFMNIEDIKEKEVEIDEPEKEKEKQIIDVKEI